MQSIKQTVWAVTVGCVAMLATPFAFAGQGRHGDHHGRRGHNDAAVGIALVIGAAALMASSQRRHDSQPHYAQSSSYRPAYGYADYGTAPVSSYDSGDFYASDDGDGDYDDSQYADPGYGDDDDYGDADDRYDGQGYAEPFPDQQYSPGDHCHDRANTGYDGLGFPYAARR